MVISSWTLYKVSINSIDYLKVPHCKSNIIEQFFFAEFCNFFVYKKKFSSVGFWWQ